ncbi:MAG: PQQ-binding-like beta-propeller repeat protein [Hyphomonadaceae bacterium]
MAGRLVNWILAAIAIIAGIVLVTLGLPKEEAGNAYMVLGGVALAVAGIMLAASGLLGAKGANWVAAAIMIIAGLSLVLPGFQLLSLGGSWYYVLAGAAIIASGVLLAISNPWGPKVYAVMLAITVPWALWESGLDLLALLPRLAAFMVAGLWFLTPWHAAAMRRDSDERGRSGATWVGGAMALGLVALLVASFQGYSVQEGTRNEVAASATPVTDWQNYGNSPGGQRFAQVDQINTGTVKELKEVWRFRTGVPYDFKNTPLQVGDLLYVCTAGSQVIALDATSGEEQWRFNPQTKVPGAKDGDLSAASTFARTCRSIGYYVAPPDYEGECKQRILIGTTDGRLTAIDAKAGRLCRSFGFDGYVNLQSGLGRSPLGNYMNTSGPLIAGNVAVVGGWVTDNQELDNPSGVVRAYDTLTGDFAWAWDMGKPDYHGLPDEGGEYTRGTPNVWSLMSYDPELNLIYAPTGNASPDYFGGLRREFDEKYSASTVAIDAATGELRWVYQNTHHDIWDYDAPSQPVLVDITKDGQRIPAVAQPTKRGEIFLMDRRTGKPIWPATTCSDGAAATPEGECAVPQGTVEGDYVTATQPFSGLPTFRPDRWEKDMWGLTPFDQLHCRIEYKKMRYEGHFTPPMAGSGGGGFGGETSGGSFQYPGNAGGFNWPSVSVDADNGLLIAQPMLMGNRIFMISENDRNAMIAERMRAAAIARGETPPPVDEHAAGQQPQREAAAASTGQGPLAADVKRYGMTSPFMSTWKIPFTGIATDMPCFEPPYGRLAVIDLNTNKLLWSRAIGNATQMGPFGQGLPMVTANIGTPIYGGTTTTRGGLIFQVGTMDSLVRAIDVRTGKVLWSAKLPGTSNSTPVTYIAEKDGRQYLVVCVPNPGFVYPRDGASKPSDDQGGYVIAYALPSAG